MKPITITDLSEIMCKENSFAPVCTAKILLDYEALEDISAHGKLKYEILGLHVFEEIKRAVEERDNG